MSLTVTLAATLADDSSAIFIAHGPRFAFVAPNSDSAAVLSWAPGGQLTGDHAAMRLAVTADQTIRARHAAPWRIDANQRPRARHSATWAVDANQRLRARHSATWKITDINPVCSSHSAPWTARLAARHVTAWQPSDQISARHRVAWSATAAVAARHGAPWVVTTPVAARHSALWSPTAAVVARHSASWSATAATAARHSAPWACTSQISARHSATWAAATNNHSRARHVSAWAVVSSAVRVLTPAPTLTHAGVVQSPLEISLTHDTGDPTWSATVTLGTAADWLPLRIGDDITLDMGATSYALIIDQLGVDRGVDTYTLKALSPVSRFGAPWVAPIALGTIGLAHAVCERLLEQTIDWGLPDWPLPSSAAALEATPLDLAQTIAAAVGGVIESNPDGSLRARPTDPHSPPRYASGTLAATLGDDDIVTRTDSVGSARIANRYTITSGELSTTDSVQIESVPHPDDPENAYRREVRAYPYPYRAIDLAHTGDSAIAIGAATDNTTEHDELIAIEAGLGRAKYPVAAILSAAYQYADLGPITTAGTEIRTATAHYSQIRLRYTAACRRWPVTNTRDETIQFIALEPPE